MSIKDILLWTIGATRDIPQSERDEVSASELYNLLCRHRLEERFLYRFIEERPQWYSQLFRGYPAWCTQDLLNSLMETRGKTKQKCRQQLAAVTHITESAAEYGTKVIWIKGGSTFALTGDNRHLHHSGDIDLFTSDPELIWNMLLQQGFAGERRTGHEFAELRKDEISIELHAFFPVLGYPPGLEAQALEPENNPGIWQQQSPWYLQRNIEFSYLDGQSLRGTTQGTQGTWVPRHEMAVLLRCVHDFRDYLKSPYRQCYVKLAPLADIYDLATRENFDPHLFLRMASEFSAEDSIRFVGNALSALFGDNPLPMPSDRNQFSKPAFPQLLSQFGGWFYDCLASDLLIPVSTATLVERLQGNLIVANREQQSRLYTSPGLGISGAQELERIHISPINDCSLPFTISAHWGLEELSFEFVLLTALSRGKVYEVHFFSKEDGEEIVLAVAVSLGGPLGHWGEGQIIWMPEEDKTVINISLPWRRLPGPFLRQLFKPFLLHIIQWDTALSKAQPDIVITVPILVVAQAKVTME